MYELPKDENSNDKKLYFNFNRTGKIVKWDLHLFLERIGRKKSVASK